MAARMYRAGAHTIRIAFGNQKQHYVRIAFTLYPPKAELVFELSSQNKLNLYTITINLVGWAG